MVYEIHISVPICCSPLYYWGSFVKLGILDQIYFGVGMRGSLNRYLGGSFGKKRLHFVGRLIVSVFFVGAVVACEDKDAGPLDQDNRWPLAWLDTDGDCQNTETETLIAHTSGLIQWASPDACDIASGQWRSWASNQSVPMSSVLVVMVVVPKNAQESGAQDWSMEDKLVFMNDPENLIILDTASAKLRGSYGPDRWVPHQAYWCEYATRWRSVKERYGLSLSEEENGATTHMIAVSCEPSVKGETETAP